MLSTCTFSDFNVKSGLTQKRKTGLLINEIILYYKKKESQITYTFVNDEFLYQMNVDYLQHDTYTGRYIHQR
jgi:probable rRNA maturation factor